MQLPPVQHPPRWHPHGARGQGGSVGALAIAALAALLVTDGFNLLTVAQLKRR